jgi:hypothetical protein
VAKPAADPMPLGARPLNVVFQEWWRRIGDPAITLGEFNRALADGRLTAWVSGEGTLPTSYWRTHRVAFDRKEPMCVIVCKGRLEALASFYIAPAPPQPMAPPSPEPESKKSKTQELILGFAKKEFPRGWKDIPTREIRKRVGEKFKKQGMTVPSYDTFLRALGRRQD